MRLLAQTMILFATAASSSLAQDVGHRQLLPVAGHVFGFSGTEWRTSIILVNDNAEEVDAAVSVVGDEQAFLFTTIPPGQSYAFDDQALGIAGRLYALEIVNGGARPLRVGAAAFGFREGAPSSAQPLALVPLPTFPAAKLISSLTFNDTTRSNVGIANLEDEAVTISLAMRRLAGRNVATLQLTVPPRSLLHAPVQTYFPLVTEGEGMSVVVDAGGRAVVAYGSVVDNRTNAARFIAGLPTIP